MIGYCYYLFTLLLIIHPLTASRALPKSVHGIKPTPGNSASKHPPPVNPLVPPPNLDGPEEAVPTPATKHTNHGNNQAVGDMGINVTGCGLSDCRPLSYRGGAVMNQGVNVYVMWYGNWDVAEMQLLEYYLNNVGGSTRYGLNTFYPWNTPTGQVTLMSTVIRNVSGYSTSLSDDDIMNLVVNEPTWAQKDSNGLYFVFTTADVNQVDGSAGFCTTYCGWHSFYQNGGSYVIYGWVGNSNRCLGACSEGPGPNGLRGADAMVSIIAHELEESTTDPLQNAYLSDSGYENGDICSWTFGTQAAFNGGTYNTVVGSLKFLIQQGVDYENIQKQVCSMTHTSIPNTPQGGQTCDTALLITPGNYTAQSNHGNSAATAPFSASSCSNLKTPPNIGYTTYYQLQLSDPLPSTCYVDTCIGDFDSEVAVFTDCGATSYVACNDDYAACAPQSNVSFSVTQDSYIIGVASWGSSFPGTYTLEVKCHWTTTAPTRPTRQPSNLPTRKPTGTPTLFPSRKPTGQPTRQPTRQPTSQPTTRPTRQPVSTGR